ncbi:SDR family oxidoreductase [Sphingomonas sp. URHD0057]|uniref:SDR family oxidoreductase n=1 Tax=Sphingomonas sp. URHD0057 TaxID=1380389 RepID=UPI000491122C|nr:SDR family oxidoreductase [Sphingomonas sp. URHD0057]
MPTVLITGANRGLGLEFARQYAADGWSVIATGRQSSSELGELGVTFETLDMGDFSAIVGLGQRISELDLLIANAGTRGPETVTGADDAREWSEAFTVNAIAPFLLAQSVLPAIRQSGGKLIAISSTRGSLSDNSPGGSVAYRSSKSALNSAWRRLAIENPDVICALFHPGWVKTGMGGPSAPIDPETSVRSLRRLIGALEPQHSGRFFNPQGKQLPW